MEIMTSDLGIEITLMSISTYNRKNYQSVYLTNSLIYTY
jgi:hypothetical protein